MEARAGSFVTAVRGHDQFFKNQSCIRYRCFDSFTNSTPTSRDALPANRFDDFFCTRLRYRFMIRRYQRARTLSNYNIDRRSYDGAEEDLQRHTVHLTWIIDMFVNSMP